jgi:hypothetical protein
MSEQLQQQIEALTTRLEQYESEMVEWRKINLSRVGPVGPRGERGIPGVNARESTVPGPEGRPGKDADISQCVAAAKSSFASEIAKMHASLGSVVVQALKDAGIIDADGQAILVAGPAGRDGRNGVDGKDSNIPGPAGRDGIDGKSIVGPAGRDGRDGADGKDSAPGRDGIDGKDGSIKLEADAVTVAHLESKFRRNWKDDIQAGIRGHFQESHTAKS